MARRQRDNLLIEMGERFVDQPSNKQRALKIEKAIRKFAAGTRQWRPGTIEELCHYCLRACPAPSARTIERALAGAPSSPPFGARNGIHLDHEDSLPTAR
jgi:hypothetical protein